VALDNRLGGLQTAKWSKMLRAEAGRAAASSCRECGQLVISTAMVPAVHPPQPFHRHDLPGHRAGNDRVAGPGVDREVKRLYTDADRCLKRIPIRKKSVPSTT
jgi:hypothetical protein